MDDGPGWEWFPWLDIVAMLATPPIVIVALLYFVL
jgi:hypothetical protein